MNFLRPFLALCAIVGVAQGLPARADVITIDPVNMRINGANQGIGKINANFTPVTMANPNAMEATFTLDKNFNDLTTGGNFHWLQLYTHRSYAVVIACPYNVGRSGPISKVE